MVVKRQAIRERWAVEKIKFRKGLTVGNLPCVNTFMRYLIPLLLCGCATIPMPKDLYRYYAPLVTGTHCTLNGAVIAWSGEKEIEYFCGPKTVGCEVNKLVILQKPESWNDWQALQILGHEVMHLCGAKHEVVK